MEEKMTAKKRIKVLGAIAVTIILAVVILVPMKVEATPLTEGTVDFYPFAKVGDPIGTLSVSVSIVEDSHSAGWVYSYLVKTYGAATKLYMMSIGNINPWTNAYYTVENVIDPIEDPAVKPSSRLTNDSLLLYFPQPSGVALPDGYSVWIEYSEPIEAQYITFRTTGPGGGTKTITATYQEPSTTVPEPMTLLLLGCGLVSLRFLSRRKS